MKSMQIFLMKLLWK